MLDVVTDHRGSLVWTKKSDAKLAGKSLQGKSSADATKSFSKVCHPNCEAQNARIVSVDRIGTQSALTLKDPNFLESSQAESVFRPRYYIKERDNYLCHCFKWNVFSLNWRNWLKQHRSQNVRFTFPSAPSNELSPVFFSCLLFSKHV